MRRQGFKRSPLAIDGSGVETEAQSNHMHRMGADCAQGYLFSKPFDAPTAEMLYRSGCKPESECNGSNRALVAEVEAVL